VSDCDEAGVYRIPGTPTLWVSAPPALEFRLPAELYRRRQNRLHLVLSVGVIAMLGGVVWWWTTTTSGAREGLAPDYSSVLLSIPFLILILGLFAFSFLHIINRIVADQYVQLFEGGAKLSLNEDHVTDNRISLAPIAWRDVASASIEAGKGGALVSLKLKPGVNIRFRRFRPDHWIFNRVLRPFGGKTVEIATDDFGVDEIALAKLIKAVAEDERG
jgi:hypothetical protein